jgi:hypothetical protein
MSAGIYTINLRYVGDSFKNCGPSAGQTSALQTDQSFQKTLNTNYGEVFSENQDLMNNLTSNLGQIIGAGPSQQGFSAAELAAKNSQNINDAAASNQKIQTAIGENGAKSGVASPGVESGIEQAERATAATQVDTNMNNNAATITQQNYDTGRQNYWSAVKGQEEAPAAFEDPETQAANSVTGSNSATATQANQNAADSTGNELLGLGEGLLSDASTVAGAAIKAGGAGCWVAAAVYDGWNDPRVSDARNFIFNVWAKESILGSIVANIYTKIGERVAELVKRSSILRSIFKPLFDIAVRKNREL